ncbi:MAG: hypothetical protein K2X86_07705 [Cytophagaceae bacterium]|nr:hypothetical protein [Cytophagaceae bacterium]
MTFPGFLYDANRSSVRTKVHAAVYRDWGTKNEKVVRKVVTLSAGKEMHDIMTIDEGWF